MSTARLGMWVFLASEIMFFTGLIGSAIVLRFGSGGAGWPAPGSVLHRGLLAANTLVLLASSVTMALASSAAQGGRQKSVQRFLLLTAFLGALFLGIKGYGYRQMWREGFTITAGIFGSCYYLLTGFHALHLLSGVVVLIALWAACSGKVLSRTAAGRVEAGGLYWHFIDIVWLILFAILCLV